MSPQKEKATWDRWEKEATKLKKALSQEDSPPAVVVRQWRQHLLFVFMQELSKNVLNEEESFESLLDRIMEAIQLGCGFDSIRIYYVNEGKGELYLVKTSVDHEPISKEKFTIKLDKEVDEAVATLFTGTSLIRENATDVKLEFSHLLNLKGPYLAIPLLFEKSPIGLICANIPKTTELKENILRYPEFFDQIDTFSRTVMSAVENRKIFEQRNQKIKQLEQIKKLSMLIQSKTEKKKLFKSLLEQGVKLVKGDSGHLKLYNQKTKSLERVADYGENEDVAPPGITQKPGGVGFSNYVFMLKEPLLIDDVSKHQIMQEHIAYWRSQDHQKYVNALEKRKSALLVPILNYKDESIGVIDVHGKTQGQFSTVDKENLLALVNSVIHAVEKAEQLEQQEELSVMRDELLNMLKDAVRKADNLNSVLAIIRDSCRKLVDVKNIKTVCMIIKERHREELMAPLVKCVRAEKNCNSCITETEIIQAALTKKEPQHGKNDLAWPVLLDNEVLGILYFVGKKRITLNENEYKILDVIVNTASILIETARNYEIKIKQGAALYEAVENTTKLKDFKEWFNPIMEKVMDIIGRENRNFHLVIVEQENGEDKLFVRATSPFFFKGKKIHVEDKLLGLELPLNGSLAGMVVNTRESKYIADVEENDAKKKDDPTKMNFFNDQTGSKSEIGFPLKVKKTEGGEEEVIGVLIIDSLLKNDFKDFDLKFHETIANYLAIAIRNQQLYEERAEFQAELTRRDREAGLNIILNDFFHNIKDPLQDIKCGLNLLRMYKDRDREEFEKYLENVERLALQLLTMGEEFSASFAKTSSDRKIEEVRTLVTNSLRAVERTTGLNLDLQGDYEKFEMVINCYPVFIELAFRSIINNAVKYSKKLDRSKRYLKIDIQYNSQKKCVLIIFESSTTEPIPEEKIQKIFEPFVRGTNQERGVGLGLSLAALCVKLHMGQIEAENVKDKEAVRFMITIPKGTEAKFGDAG